MKQKSSFIKFNITIIFLMLFAGFFVFVEKTSAFSDVSKHIVINDDGLNFDVQTNAETVQDALKNFDIEISSYDTVFPGQEERLFSGGMIVIHRAKKVRVSDGANKKEFYTTQKRVEDAIFQQKDFKLEVDDFTTPARNALVKDGMQIFITHVLIKEEIIDEKIPFKTVVNEDDKLSWRSKKVTQKGENGINKTSYRTTYYNGKEISRKVLNKEKTKDPVDEIVTQGTYVKVGKSHSGVASWYAYTGTMSAANPWLPMGSYVKVTNVENGKSVIVKINDRGPFGNGRIIDLDKVAFAQIASLGAGVANIKMEEISN